MDMVDGNEFQMEPPDKQRKPMSCGLEVDCPADIRDSLMHATNDGYHFLVTYPVNPHFARDVLRGKCRSITRTDRILAGTDWNRLIVGKITEGLDVDSEINVIQQNDSSILRQELDLTTHFGLPAIVLKLRQANNANLAAILYNKLTAPIGTCFQVWIHLPMVHPSRYSPLCKGEEYDMWDWWNDLRTYCHYDKRLGLALDVPEAQYLPSAEEMDRWLGEPVKVMFIHTSIFLTNSNQRPVLSKAHQLLIESFMALDVQYVIKGPVLHGNDYKFYSSYINFLGKKLFHSDAVTDYIHGCEDYLQNPLQPLTENLDAMVYEVFEKDKVKYAEYQNAIQKALEELSPDIETPVVMVVGAGRGPLVQAALNASYILQRKIKTYAVEKNPFAINTLADRNKYEWQNQVTLIEEDMRVYQPPELADILVSELLGSFGDNELSPECLDGAQRFLKQTGISIPASYTSFIAPLQSTKIFNEIKTNRPLDKTLESVYETPYIVHLVNYYQIAPSQEVHKFEHPNRSEIIDNKRYCTLKFHCSQNCLLTGFVGYFETVLYKDIKLSINPQTYSKGMISWFPIIFPLMEPVHVHRGNSIDISFWRAESHDKVWYQWCLQSPVKSQIINPGGRSYFIKKF